MQFIGGFSAVFCKETVINCFQKANISEEDQMNAVNDVDDPFKELNESMKELRTKDPSLVPENMTVQDVVEADGQVITSAPFLTDELILEEVSTMDEEDETNGLADNGDDVDEKVKAPSLREVEHSLETLKNYSLFRKNRGRQMIDIIFKFENLLIVEKSENYRQSAIFFSLGFLSRSFANHRTAGEGGGHFFNSSLPLPPSSQTLRR